MSTATDTLLENNLDTANYSTQRARDDNTILAPRFYTTDFDAMDKLDISPVQKEWDEMMAEFHNDNNKDHFKRPENFDAEVKPLADDLYKEFEGFLISSLTSEYSGCVLYADIRRRVKNPAIKELMGLMARDESRHAGFINQSLKNFGVGIDLGCLKQEKKIHVL